MCEIGIRRQIARHQGPKSLREKSSGRVFVLVRNALVTRLEFVARELGLAAGDVESLLVDMILDKRIVGKVDQINGFLQLGDGKSSLLSKKYDSIAKWTAALSALSNTCGTRIP